MKASNNAVDSRVNNALVVFDTDIFGLELLPGTSSCAWWSSVHLFFKACCLLAAAMCFLKFLGIFAHSVARSCFIFSFSYFVLRACYFFVSIQILFDDDLIYSEKCFLFRSGSDVSFEHIYIFEFMVKLAFCLRRENFWFLKIIVDFGILFFVRRIFFGYIFFYKAGSYTIYRKLS